jgi:cell division protein FtsW
VKRQLLWAALGGAAAFIVSLTPLSAFRRWMPVILLGTLAAVLLPFLPSVGTSVLGSRRWISLFGLSFQPSELVKVTLVLYLASYFAKREESGAITMNVLIPPFLVTCVFAAIVLLQNDYSTAIFILVMGLAMMYISQVRLLHFFLVTLYTVPLGFLLLFTREHRVQRLLAFFDLSNHSSGTGYQIVTAKAALVSGGLFGKGLGRSAAKLGPLPMSYSDFIYTIVGEETGLLGALFVLALFALLAWRGYRIALLSTDRFSKTAAFGLTSALCLQADDRRDASLLLRGRLVAVHHAGHVRTSRESFAEGDGCLMLNPPLAALPCSMAGPSRARTRGSRRIRGIPSCAGRGRSFSRSRRCAASSCSAGSSASPL